MSSYLALAISVGVLAVVATWIFSSVDPVVMAQMQVWQAFIAWGCHYHSGGKIKGTTTTIVCMSFGAVVGMTAGWLVPQLSALGQLDAPVAVGLGALVICLASKVPFLGTIPASVYGFASIAGLFLLGTGVTPTGALLPTILSIIVGAAFGYVSEAVAGALGKK